MSTLSKQLTKICKNCGREITWRKKWEKNWSSIAYCSSSCRRPLGALDLAFEAGILELLSARRRAAVVGLKKGGASLASITVEEVEEVVMERWAAAGNLEIEEEGGEDDRRSASPPPTSSSAPQATPRASPIHVRERARKAARRLVDRRVVDIWQKGPRGMAVVNPSFAKGTLELRGVEGQPVDLVVPAVVPENVVEELEEGGKGEKGRRKR